MPHLPGLERRHPLVLAPLEEITDGPFRRLAKRFGADLVYTELVSAEGLVHGARAAHDKMRLSPEEHPVAIQVCGSRVASVVAAALQAVEAGADIVDLNFGCPARKVAGRGAGAGLLRTPALLEEMARATVAAVPRPVTAKVRLGWDSASVNVLEIAARLEAAGVAGIAVHARTRSQGFQGRADWSWIARVKAAVGVAVIGNGDVWEPEDAARMFRETGCDAVMIGRGAMGNPWIFSRARRYLETGEFVPPPPFAERAGVVLDQLRDAAAEKGERRAVIEMRKHYRGYWKGLPGAARLRAALMTPHSLDGVRRILDEHARNPASAPDEEESQRER